MSRRKAVTRSRRTAGPVVIPYPTFAEKVAPLEVLCLRIIERHGGTPLDGRTLPDLRTPWIVRAGFVFSHPVTRGSELDYALKVRLGIRRALVAADQGHTTRALKLTWDTACLLQEAAITFRWKAKTRAGAQKAAAERTAAAEDRVARWRHRVAGRKPGMSKNAVYRLIADADGVHPGTVRRAVLRHKRQR